MLCTKCKEDKDDSEFYRRSDTGRLRSHCKACTNAKTLHRYHTDPKVREQHGNASWKHQIMKLYGLTVERYNEMLAEQGDSCLICKTPLVELKQKRLYIDHNHETMEVRGLLCSSCNWLLQNGRESASVLRRAADYLDSKGSYPEEELMDVR